MAMKKVELSLITFPLVVSDCEYIYRQGFIPVLFTKPLRTALITKLITLKAKRANRSVLELS